LVLKPFRLLSGSTWPVLIIVETNGLSTASRFGRSPPVACVSSFVSRFANGTYCRFTVTPGWAASNDLV
jgi:hypothetical protein